MQSSPPIGPAPGPFLRLPLFEGPLDLLLHLCRRAELPLIELPLGEVTRQFLAYLAVMEELELDVAGEFVEMAALLCLLKSRELLPRLDLPGIEDEDDGEDPRLQLVQRLLAYKSFKVAADSLTVRPRPGLDFHVRPLAPPEEGDDSLAPLDCDLTDLLSALRDLVERARWREAVHEVGRPGIPLAQAMAQVLDAIAAGARTFAALIPEHADRSWVVVTFLAVLHLAVDGRLRIAQERPGMPIVLEAA